MVRIMKCKTGRAPEGTLSRTTGVRKDHWRSIILGGRGPGSVALFCTIASDSLRNSCRRQSDLEVLVCRADYGTLLHAGGQCVLGAQSLPVCTGLRLRYHTLLEKLCCAPDHLREPEVSFSQKSS